MSPSESPVATPDKIIREAYVNTRHAAGGELVREVRQRAGYPTHTEAGTLDAVEWLESGGDAGLRERAGWPSSATAFGIVHSIVAGGNGCPPTGV